MGGGKVRGVGGCVPDGRGGLGKSEEGPGGWSQMDEGLEGSVLGGRRGRGSVLGGRRGFGDGREKHLCVWRCSRWALGVPGVGMAVLRCVKASGGCGEGKGAGAVDGVVDYPELEGVHGDHGVQLS